MIIAAIIAQRAVSPLLPFDMAVAKAKGTAEIMAGARPVDPNPLTERKNKE
jgi:hypothetical protein